MKKILQLDELDFSKLEGLIPVVAQSFETGEVLMQAFANLEAVKLTLTSGYAHYWSRSRGKLWKKGEISGNLQEIEKSLWIVMLMLWSIKYFKKDLPATPEKKAVFSANWLRIKHDLEQLF